MVVQDLGVAVGVGARAVWVRRWVGSFISTPSGSESVRAVRVGRWFRKVSIAHLVKAWSWVWAVKVMRWASTHGKLERDDGDDEGWGLKMRGERRK